MLLDPDKETPLRAVTGAQRSVSVVIAAYNSAHFIERAVASALAQQCGRLEVIVADDGSTDRTCEVVNVLARADSRVRLLTTEDNSGPSAARNRGIAAAVGDWVAILDADDAFAPGRLAFMVDLAQRCEADIVADNFLYHDIHAGTFSDPALRIAPATQLIDVYAFVWGSGSDTIDADFGLLKPIFSRSFLIDRNLRYPENVRHGEDWELVFEALKEGAVYVLARDRATYFYTTRSSGHSRTQIAYPATAERALKHARVAEARGDAALAQLLKQRADHTREVHLDYFGSMPSARRPRLEMLSTALKTPVGRSWLARRMKDRFGFK